MPNHPIRFYEYKGKPTSVNELAKIAKLPYYLIHKRVKALGWTAEEAVGHKPLWATRGGCYEGQFKICRRDAEQYLDDMELNELPKNLRKLVMTVPNAGPLPYGKTKGKTWGRFLRTKCKPAFDKFYEEVFYPKQRAIYDQHIKQNQQALGLVGENPKSPGNPCPNPVGHHPADPKLLPVADRLSIDLVVRPTGDSLLFCR